MSANEILDVTLKVIGILAPISIGYYYFSGYDVKKNVVNKQLDEVCKLINEIYELRFSYDYKGKLMTATVNEIIKMSKEKKLAREIRDKEIYFQPTNFINLSIWSKYDHPFIPKSIGQTLNVFVKTHSTREIIDLNDELNLKLDMKIPENLNMVWFYIFVSSIEQVKSAIKKWLADNRFKDLNY